MNAAHLHIVLVHFPLVLLPVALTVLVGGALLRNRAIKGVALALLVFAALVTVPAFLLGEGAEELVEHLSGVSEQLIEEHEEAAEIAFWLTNMVGALSLAALFGMWRRAIWFGTLLKVVVVAALVASVALFYAGYQGGEIRHPEAYTG